METTTLALNTLLHIDQFLFAFIANYGTWTYLVLFLIIFCETGLVITPFLPGDSLLFAAGSLAANNAPSLNIWILFILLFFASTLGNKLNYTLGRILGKHLQNPKIAPWINQQHLEKAHLFYERHGGKAIIFARFLPIIRTFAPFVAGISYMTLTRFSFYNIISALLWISSLLGMGYLFGNLTIVKQNFTLVIYTIIGVSLIPAILGVLFKK